MGKILTVADYGEIAQRNAQQANQVIDNLSETNVTVSDFFGPHADILRGMLAVALSPRTCNYTELEPAMKVTTSCGDFRKAFIKFFAHVELHITPRNFLHLDLWRARNTMNRLFWFSSDPVAPFPSQKEDHTKYDGFPEAHGTPGLHGRSRDWTAGLTEKDL